MPTKTDDVSPDMVVDFDVYDPTIAGQVGYANAFREAMRATSGS